MIRDLVPSTDPVLRKKTEKFDLQDPPTDPIQLVRDMAETMISNNGLGLSAPQIGLPYRVFVITGQQILACFNPIIVDTSSEEIYLEEGCLTFPGLFINIKRPRMIRARFTMPNGQVETRKFDGMTSRIFQHELDHLNGVLFMTRATLYHKDKARRDQKKNKTTFVKTESQEINIDTSRDIEGTGPQERPTETETNI